MPSIFFVAAALYGLFAIPLFLVVREAPTPGAVRPTARDAALALTQLRTTIRNARTVPGLGRFLLGRFFYSDAVNTIIVVMAIVATEAMGLSKTVANLILLSLAVVAVLASFGWGALVDRIGPKRTLMAVLASWAIGLVLGGISLGVPGTVGLVMFLLAGAILGSGLGGVQVADRVLMVRLSPPEQLGAFFGLYGLVGKGSQVIGQLLYGAINVPVAHVARRRGVPGGRAQPSRDDAHRCLAGGPVSDRWSGSGELPSRDAAAGTPRARQPRRSSPADRRVV